MERLRSIFGSLNTTLLGTLVLGLAIALVLVPRLAKAPLPSAPIAASAAPQVAGQALAAGPEQPPPPPAPRPAAPDHPFAAALPPAPHALPQLGLEPLPRPGYLDGWMDWLVHWFAVTGATTLLACLVLTGLLLWRSWSLCERDVVTQM